MVFMKGFIVHIPCEGETNDADSCTEPVTGLEDLIGNSFRTRE